MTKSKTSSFLKTFSYQDQLPSYPVPSLSSTCLNYLESIYPHLSHIEYEKSKEMVTSFMESEYASTLQNILIARSSSELNWLEEWWEYAAYLSWRGPIAIGINMFTGFGSFTEFSKPVPQARRAAEIVRYTIEYHHLLLSESIAPETMSRRVLCMNMFTRIFAVCRVPGEPADRMARYDASTSTEIVVFCKEHVFFLPVYYASTRDILTIGDFEAQITHVLHHACHLSSSEDGGVGAFTGTTRSEWAAARGNLCALSALNVKNIERIQSSLFALCLDDLSPQTPSELISGTAAGEEVGNRWFDKSLQYVVFANGMVGANLEHGNADATIFMSMFKWLGERYLCRSGGYETFIESKTQVYLPPPVPVSWILNDELRTGIQKAKTEFQIRAANFSPAAIRFKGFGRPWIKKSGFPPDAFVQMALQLAYTKITGTHCPTYESAHTRFFFHGRTETIRSCTEESIAFCNSMLSTSTTSLQKKTSLETAVAKHMEIGMAALNGEGFDRHLLGLQIASILNGTSLPELFSDPSYNKAGGGGNFVLSSSNVSGYQWLWGGFAPMTPHGVGVCYDIDMEFIGFLITTTKSNVAPCTSRAFGEALFEALREMKEMIQQSDDDDDVETKNNISSSFSKL